MKKMLAVLSVMAMTIPVPASARGFDGDIGSWRREMREIRVAEPKAVEVRPTETDAAGCAVMKLDEVVISRGVLSNDFTVENGGREIGTIEKDGASVVIRSGPAIAAKTSGEVVTDCAGAVIGSVSELAGEGSSRFAIKDASGRIVAASGEVDGHSMVLKGSGGMVAVQNNHWLKDSYKVSVSGVDPRLAAVVLAALGLCVNVYAGMLFVLKDRGAAQLRNQATVSSDLESFYERIETGRKFLEGVTKGELPLHAFMKLLSFSVPEHCVLKNVEYLRSSGSLVIAGVVEKQDADPYKACTQLTQRIGASPFFAKADLAESGTGEKGDYQFKIVAKSHGF